MRNLKMATLGTLLTGVLAGVSPGGFASDHGDTPLLVSNARHDARLTDVLILQRGAMLSFMIDSNPTIQQQTTYRFATDITFKSYIDNHTQPLFTDPILTPILGGTFTDPSQIREDMVLTYTFDANNTMSVKIGSPVTELGVSGFYPERVASGALVYVLGSGFVPQSRNAPQNTWVRIGEKDVEAFVLSSNMLVFVAHESHHGGRITLNNAASSVTTASPISVLKTEGERRNTVTQRVLGMIRNNDPAIAAIAAGDFPSLAMIGLPVQTFSGMRDDMFIRGPQKGRNIAVVAAEMPISLFTTGRQKTLIGWGTANVEGVAGTPFAAGHEEIAGRSFGSMFSPEQSVINTLPPSQHVSGAAFLGVVPALGRTIAPDVIIFDTTRPQSFPNGRELNDDIINLIGPSNTNVNVFVVAEQRLCDASGDLRDCPTVNDVPHSATFPYLGLPHDHPPTTIP